MAQTILIKRSNTSGAVPTTSQLSVGELALNTRDGKIYMRKYIDGTTGNDTITLIGDNSTIAGSTFTGNLNLGDNVKAQFGAGNDLAIYHDGSNSHIRDQGTGNLQIEGQSDVKIMDNLGSTTMATFRKNGPVFLTYNNSTKFATSATGIDVTGTVQATALSAASTYTSIIYGGASSLQLKSNTSEMFAEFNNNGNAELYYDNSKKFETTSTGIDVTGTINSGAITSTELTITGGSDGADLHINNTSPTLGFTDSNSFSDSNDIYIVRGTSTGKLQFQFFDHSANTTTQTFLIDQSGNTDIAGTISAGVFTTNANTGTFSNSIGTFPLMTSTPYDYVAKFESTDAGAAIIIEDSSSTNNANRIAVSGNTMKLVTAATTALTINASQNVNIPNGSLMVGATTAPSGLVHLSQAGGADTMLVFENTSGTNPFQVGQGNDDSLRFYYNLSEKMRIDTSGRVNIGNTTNFSAADADDLQVGNTTGAHGISIISSNSHNGNLFFGDNDNNDAGSIRYNHTNNRMEFYTDRTQRMTIDSSGNVGIGTTAPSAALHISGTSAEQIRLERSGHDTFRIGLSHSVGLNFYNVTDSRTEMMISGAGNVGIGTTSPSKQLTVSGADAEFLLSRTGSYADTINMGMPSGVPTIVGGTDLAFGGTGTWTEHMRIKADGKVGIGTTAPSKPLHVQFSGDHGARIESEDNHASLYIDSHTAYGQYIRFTENNADKYWINSIGGKLVFRPAATTTAANQITFNATGNVGIGESIPTEKLHVGGNIKMQATTAIVTYQNAANTWNIGLDAADASFKFKDGTAERIRIDSSGNVGIGTTAPAALLHVKSAGNGEIEVERTSGALINLQAQAAAGYIGTDSNHLFGLKANGTVRLKIATSGAISFNDAFTFPTADGSANQLLKTDGSGNMSWVTVSGAGTPSYIADADGDTKIQVEESSDEDTIRFDAAGVERFKIGSDVQVMGTTDFNITGSNRRISFTSGTGTVRTSGASSLNFGTSNTDRMTITSAGNVGIGTTAPGQKLQVQGNIAAKATGADAGISLTKSDSNNTLVHLLETGTGDGAVTVRNTSNAQTVLFRGQGNNYITGGSLGIGHTSPVRLLHIKGTGSTVAAKIEATDGNQASLDLTNSEGAFRVITNGGTLQIYDDGDSAERMRIDTSGNVGIGTTGPAQKLHVVGSAIIDGGTGVASTGVLHVRQSGDTLNNGIALTSSHATSHRIWKDSTGKLNFGPTSLPSAFVQDLTGKIGIGTTAPAYKLDVAGSFQAKVGSSAIAFNEYSNGATIWLDGSNGDFAGGDYFNISAYGTTDLAFGYAAVTKMTLKSTGNLGIGTSSPAQKLHVSAGSTNANTIARLQQGTTAGNYSAIEVGRTDGSGNVELTPAVTGGVPIAGTAGILLGSTNGSIPAVGIQTPNSSNGHIVFNPKGSERARIQATGELLLNATTTAFGDKLYINGDAYVTGGWRIGTGATYTGKIYNSSGIMSIETDSSRDIQFGNSGTPAIMYIDTSTENVGIGTTSPDATLRIDNESGVALKVTGGAVGNTIASFVRDVGGSGTVNIGANGSDPQIAFTSTGNTFAVGVNSNTFEIADNTTIGTNTRFSITNTGNVGIGVTAPTAKLHVDAPSTTAVSLTGGAAAGQIFTNEDFEFAFGLHNASPYPLYIQGRSSSTSTTASRALVLNPLGGNVGIGTTAPGEKLSIATDTDVSAEIGRAHVGYIGHSDYAGFSHIDRNTTSAYALLQGAAGQTYINSASGQPIRFRINNVDTMILTSSGNLGIGTTAPNTNVQIYHATDDVSINVNHGTGGSYPKKSGISFGATSTSLGGDATFTGGAGIQAINTAASNNPTEMAFFTTSAGSPTERMRIDSLGNVGIGTTAPSEKLHIHNGSIYVTPVSYAANQDDWALKIGASNNAGWDFAGIKLRVDSSGNPRMSLMGTGQQEAMALVGSRVGIGTTAPAKTLDVAANGASQGIHLNISGVGRLQMYADGDRNYFNGLSGNGHRFTTTGGANVEILNNGNVGIGTTSPTHKLHVAGDIRINNGSALKLYNAAGNGWAQISYNNTLNLIEIQRDFQSGTDSTNSLGSSAKKWLSVYSDTIKAGNGTPAAPSYTFDSDQNTGMYIDSTGDTLRFSTGGAQRMFLNNAGITSASNVYTGSGGEFRNYAGTWKATTGTAAGDFEFRGNTGGTNTGLMYMDTSTGRVAVGNGFNSTNVKAALQVEVLGIETNQSSVASTSQYTCESFPAADFRSARYTVQVTNVTDSTYHVTEILLIHDGTTPAITEFATIFTGSAAEATFDADINSGNVRLLATPASSDNMQFKVVRHSILV